MPKDQGLLAYEERYRLVYEAGARFWWEHEPHPLLVAHTLKIPKGSTCIEFGCGEGFEARFLAGRGMKVTAIDLSPSAIARAEAETPDELNVVYRVGDITDLKAIGIPDSSFDLGIDVHCLHMFSDPVDRKHYLSEVKRVLKPGGRFYLQNMLALDDVMPKNEAEARTIMEIKAFQAAHKGGDRTPRPVKTQEGIKDILLPLCPGCKAQSLQGYIGELTQAGFTVLNAERGGSSDGSYAAIIFASL
jgi:SAM-dependent methyltransferase